MEPASGPREPGEWTPETVEFLFAMGARHWTEREHEDASFPAAEWVDQSPTHWLQIFGYQEPTTGEWRWLVEACDSPHGMLVFTRRCADFHETTIHAARLLNENNFTARVASTP